MPLEGPAPSLVTGDHLRVDASDLGRVNADLAEHQLPVRVA
jgi:hypothetical protein